MASVESHLLQELLPKNALQMMSPLSEDDKEILAYLVAFGRRVTEASSPVTKFPWRRWTSTTKHGSRPYSYAAEVSSKKWASFATRHDFAFTCDCFACYASFWSRWDTSPSRDLIHEVLDEVEMRPEIGKGKRKKRQGKKKGDSFPSYGVVVPTDGTLAVMDDAVNETAKASVKVVDDAPLNNNVGTVGPRMGEQGKDIMRFSDSTNLKNVSSNLVDLTDKVYHSTLGNEAFVLSEVQDDQVRDVNVKANLVSGALGEGLSKDCTPGKITSRRWQHHRTGKCKSNQVIPLDYEEDAPLPGGLEPDVAIVSEAFQNCTAARGADVGIGNRGFLARLFPDTLGRVTSGLWELVTFRLRS